MTAGNDAEPEFSVITIFHNEERFLADAVASVAAQTGPRWELLLVDDGSTDTGPAIAKSLAGDRPEQVRYLTHDGGSNRGMSASRNLGVEQARGRWLTFLDADDVWLPGKLEQQARLLRQHPGVEVLVSPAQWWYRWEAASGGPADHVQELAAVEGSSMIVEPPVLLDQFLRDEWLSICDLVISRDAFERLGGYEPPFTGMFEDQVFHAKVLSQMPAVVSSRWWYRYRQHPLACTTTAHQRGAHDRARRQFLGWLDSYLAAGRYPEDLRRLVKRQRRPLDHPHLWRARRVAGRISRLGGTG